MSKSRKSASLDLQVPGLCGVSEAGGALKRLWGQKGSSIGRQPEAKQAVRWEWVAHRGYAGPLEDSATLEMFPRDRLKQGDMLTFSSLFLFPVTLFGGINP